MAGFQSKEFKPGRALVPSTQVEISISCSFTVVHSTEVIKNTLTPSWAPFIISVSTLCNGDRSRTIKVECYDWNREGGNDFIGGFMTTLENLAKGPGKDNVYEVINSKLKMKKKFYKNSGKCFLQSITIQTQHSFLDFISGGLQINVTVAVDLTASNGDPVNPTSLHHCRPDKPSLYARALKAVGEILEFYDSDKLFSALGFGARLPPDGTISHDFFLNFNPSQPFCKGTDGVLDAYYNAVQSVQLYGPTNFAPVINHVAQFARAHPDGSHFFVLLILTDGVVTDMQNTKAAIVEAATLPMAIIIVGIGDADFSAMVELDGDDVRLSYGGRKAERDIVQFVPFRDFIDRHGNLNVSQAYLAKEVLEELPDQVLSYMANRDIQPQRARASSTSSYSSCSSHQTSFDNLPSSPDCYLKAGSFE